MREIGSFIYRPSNKSREKWVICPDCLGTLYLTVIMGDGTAHTIPCAECSAGYEPPRGEVREYDVSPHVERLRVDGMSVDRSGVTYKCDMSGDPAGSHGYTTVKEADCYDDEESALAAAVEQAAEWAKRERTTKRDHNRTWAWHCVYHRAEIKRAQATIERSQGLLDYAKTKAKK